MKKVSYGKVDSNGLNTTSLNLKTAKERIKEQDEISCEILRKILLRCCGGGEYGLFFIPRRNVFEKLNQALAKYSALIRDRITESCTPVEKCNEDGDWDPEFYGGPSVESIMISVERTLKQNLMLSMRGHMRVVMLDERPINSFPTNFGSFCTIVRSFGEPKAFHPKTMADYLAARQIRELKRKRRKDKDIEEPIFFKMRATIPISLEKQERI